MSDFDSFGSSSSPSDKGDKELQEFLLVEKQKAQFNAQVRCYLKTIYFAVIFTQYSFMCRFTNSTIFAGTNASTKRATN